MSFNLTTNLVDIHSSFAYHQQKVIQIGEFMRKTILLLSVFITALLAISAFAQDKTEETKKEGDSIFTKWDIVITAPGQDLLGTLNLEKNGDEIKGVIITDMGEVPFRNIKITEDSFTADISANIQGQSFDGTATGKLEEGKISGYINLAGIGEIPYSGKKAE